jgi:actin-related protein
VKELISSYSAVGRNITLKLKFLLSHSYVFRENMGALSDEHGEKFHQNISQNEKRYSGKLNTIFWLTTAVVL